MDERMTEANQAARTFMSHLPEIVGWGVLAALGILVILAIATPRGGSLDDQPADVIRKAVDAATAPGEGE